MAMVRDYSRWAAVIFYNADLEEVSPVVSDYWPRPLEELLRESGAMFTTTDPASSCARFIGWYLAQPEIDDLHLKVNNLRILACEDDGNGAEPPKSWNYRLLAEVSGWMPNPVMARLDVLEITQGSSMLWRSMQNDAEPTDLTDT